MADREVNTEKEFNKFYLKYSKAIIRYIYKIVHDLDKSEDLTHDTFIRFFNNVDDYDTESIRTKNYLYTIARNLSFDFIKRARMEESRYMTVHFDEVHLTKNFYTALDSSFIHGEIISTIHDTIDKFSGRKKSIAVERIFHNKNLSALSKQFDISSYHIKRIEEEAYSEIRLKLIQVCPGLEFDPDTE
jgi:RNA polymerase sigma factor (sigma-70 family)